MVDIVSPPALVLLLILKSSNDSGAFSVACDGSDRRLANNLEKDGLAEWKGESWGSSFWAITEDGIEYCNKVRHV